MLGPLHTEMAFLGTIGHWLSSSDWTTVIHNAGITRSGVANALLSGHDTARTKYCHQITACVLNILMKKAYSQYSLGTTSSCEFNLWCKQMELKYPQFRYWSITLKMELTLMAFLKSIRNGDFALYRDSMNCIIPWFCTLDHYYYARWLSIHWYDMSTLDQTNPNTLITFNNGDFVITRIQNPFSSMEIEQYHKQLDTIVKGDGGAMGITKDKENFRR